MCGRRHCIRPWSGPWITCSYLSNLGVPLWTAENMPAYRDQAEGVLFTSMSGQNQLKWLIYRFCRGRLVLSMPWTYASAFKPPGSGYRHLDR